MSAIRSFRTPLRSVPRPSIAGRAPRIRFQSTSSNAGPTSSRSHITTGLVSGTAAAVIAYGIFILTPAGRVQRRINSAVYEADKTYKDAAAKFQQNTPSTQQALDSLRETAYTYAAFIPGGRGYVDTAFKDLDALREGHGEEVDKIVSDTYEELKEVSKGGLSTDTLSKALDAIYTFFQKIGNVASDALPDLLDNHPQLKEKLGPGIDQLKQLGDRLGSEAKKEVNQTWEQVSKILHGGFTVQNVNKIRQLIQDKTESVKKLGDKAWNEGMEQAKPMLDKNPKIKQLVEENAETLKQGNAAQLFQKVSESVQSGNIDDLQSYISSTIDQVKQSSGGGFAGFEKYLTSISGGSEILSQLNNVSKLSEQKTEEAEQVLKETMDKLKDVLTQQSKKVEEQVRKS